MRLVEIIKRIDSRLTQRAAEIDAHKKSLAYIDGEIETLRAERQMVSGGLDLEKVGLAETVIGIRGDYTETTQRKKVVQAAISDVAKGCSHLKNQYFGVKVYSGFGEQLAHHEYGYGPKHGSIVFAVQLKNKSGLSEEEAEAAVYYLLNIEKIWEAKKRAAA